MALSDGVIFLRPLSRDDAAAHLAGEDDAIAERLSGGRSSLEGVKFWIELCQEQWRTDGPRRAFGVFDEASGGLVGTVEANLSLEPEPGDVNVSYGVFAPARGHGIAVRAVLLLREHLRQTTSRQHILLRIHPDNAASLRVAEKLGATCFGVVLEEGKPIVHYRLKIG